RAVHRGGELRERADRRGREAEPERQVARLVPGKSDHRVDRFAQDLLRMSRGDLLDLHSALAGGHEDVARDRAVEREPEIQLPPAWICAFTTATGLPVISSRAAATASSADVTNFPRGTATPNRRRISFAWYSWIFIEAPFESAADNTPRARCASEPSDARREPICENPCLVADGLRGAGPAAPRACRDAHAVAGTALAGGGDRRRGTRKLVGTSQR